MSIAWTPEKDEALRRLWNEGALTPEISKAIGASRGAIMRRSLTLRLGIHPKATNKRRMNAKTKATLLQMHDDRKTIRHMSEVTGFDSSTICRFLQASLGFSRGREVAEKVVLIPPEVLLDRERRYGLVPRDLTASLMGDPLPTMSALERRHW